MLIGDESVIEPALIEAMDRRDFLFFLGKEGPYAFMHNIEQLADISVECYDSGEHFYTIVSTPSDDFVNNCLKMVLNKFKR